MGILDQVVVAAAAGAQDSQAHRVGKLDSLGEGLGEGMGKVSRGLEERLD